MALPAAIPIITAGVNIAGSIFSANAATKQRNRARRQERRARREMDRLKAVYANLDTSNPYLNMENTMEDLTINQQQAQFQSEQLASQQANTLQALRGAAGGSGIASLAQSLVQQGQIGAQRASASIGQQEAMNQRLAAQQAGRIQTLERQGEVLSRQMRRDQVGTLLGMSQMETAAARGQRAQAQQARIQAITGGISGATSAIAAGMQYGAFGSSDAAAATDVATGVTDTFDSSGFSGAVPEGLNQQPVGVFMSNQSPALDSGMYPTVSPAPAPAPAIEGLGSFAPSFTNPGVQGTFYNTGASYFGPNQAQYNANVYEQPVDPYYPFGIDPTGGLGEDDLNYNPNTI